MIRGRGRNQETAVRGQTTEDLNIERSTCNIQHRKSAPNAAMPQLKRRFEQEETEETESSLCPLCFLLFKKVQHPTSNTAGQPLGVKIKDVSGLASGSSCVGPCCHSPHPVHPVNPVKYSEISDRINRIDGISTMWHSCVPRFFIRGFALPSVGLVRPRFRIFPFLNFEFVWDLGFAISVAKPLAIVQCLMLLHSPC